MATTNGLALPIPELTEDADGPEAFSDALNAVEDYFFDRVLPTGVTRYPSYHWGSGTGFPSTGSGTLVRPGDTFIHTGLKSIMRWNGAAWRQIERAEIGTTAERTAISTTYSAFLHSGFQVFVGTGSEPGIWEWSGSAWFQPNTWVTLLENETYTAAIGGSAANIPSGGPYNVAVPAGRQLEIEFQVPKVVVGAGAGGYVRLVVGGGIYDAAEFSTTAGVSMYLPLVLHAVVPGGATRDINVQAWVAAGSMTLAASPATGARIRLRYKIV